MGHSDKPDDRLGDFRPRIGRTDRARDRAAASGSLRVAALVRRGHGRLRASRTVTLAPTAGFGPRPNARRVVVKAHLQRLGGHGAQAAARHLRYIERDGVEKDGSPGVLYGPEGPASRERFEEPRLGERHQFRFIVSPEDARDLDLTDYVRELMARVERDIGRSLEWAAVNHFDTEHPHAHIVVRGVCREGQPLRMDRAYIARGLRWTAQELATERLGPRLAIEIRRTHEREVIQERFTSLDREIEHVATERRVEVASFGRPRQGPEPALLVRRLAQLERLGLAEKAGPSTWVLAEDWPTQLRQRGERGDVLKAMHRALHGGDPRRFHEVRRGQGLPDGQGGVDERTLVGRVVRKGLADELKGQAFYAVIETPTGEAYHLTLGARDADGVRVGDLVAFGTKREPAVQPIDRQLAAVAAAHHGLYEVARDAEGRDVVPAAPRRLRELERLGLLTSPAAGQWIVPPDLIERLEKRQREAPARYHVFLEAMPHALDAQVGRHGPVWLDTLDPARLATQGFGAEVLAAVERRQRALAALGIAPGDPDREARIRDLEPRAVGGKAVGKELARQGGAEALPDSPELARCAAGEKLARETRTPFLKTVPEGFRGRVQAVDPGSPYLAVSDGARFVLVPATPEALALRGRIVDVARDGQGGFAGLRARTRDRER